MKHYDADHDGKLSKKETVAAKKGLEILRARTLKQHDINRDGKLDQVEVRTARIGVEKKVTASMRKHDVDGNGVLNSSEKASFEKDVLATFNSQHP